VPSEVFASEKTLNFNNSTLHLKYYGPAHTDSDISVVFAEADILHCGDTFWNGFYPFIDYSSGGSIDGMIKAAEANVAAVSNKTIVILVGQLQIHSNLQGSRSAIGFLFARQSHTSMQRNIK